MNTPQRYWLVAEGEDIKEGIYFSNLDWGKNEAVARAKQAKLSQMIYQLVPVYGVDVKITYDFPIMDYSNDNPSPKS